MNTSLPGRLFLPTSARGIPGEFSSRLHLGSHGANVQGGQRGGMRGWLVSREVPREALPPLSRCRRTDFPTNLLLTGSQPVAIQTGALSDLLAYPGAVAFLCESTPEGNPIGGGLRFHQIKDFCMCFSLLNMQTLPGGGQRATGRGTNTRPFQKKPFHRVERACGKSRDPPRRSRGLRKCRGAALPSLGAKCHTGTQAASLPWLREGEQGGGCLIPWRLRCGLK